MKAIWCLFSVENNYDQPENNLCQWWDEKPSIEVLANAVVGQDLGDCNDDQIVMLVSIWTGKGGEVEGGTLYRLQEVKEGEKL